MSRVYETVLLVFLMIVMALLMVAVLTSIFFSQDDQVSGWEATHSVHASIVEW